MPSGLSVAVRSIGGVDSFRRPSGIIVQGRVVQCGVSETGSSPVRDGMVGAQLRGAPSKVHENF